MSASQRRAVSMWSLRVFGFVFSVAVCGFVFAEQKAGQPALPEVSAAVPALLVATPEVQSVGHSEVAVPAPRISRAALLASQARTPAKVVTRAAFTSVQVNTDALGANIVGDAANEPSIAVDPTDPSRLVIGWRQFDTIASNFRQAGAAYSHDGAATWTSVGPLDPGQFRSDPVLMADNNGTFFYLSLSSITSMELFRSLDGGVTWSAPVTAHGGDKEWMAVDTTGGPGDGNIYIAWNVEASCCDVSSLGAVTLRIPFRRPTP